MMLLGSECQAFVKYSVATPNERNEKQLVG